MRERTVITKREATFWFTYIYYLHTRKEQTVMVCKYVAAEHRLLQLYDLKFIQSFYWRNPSVLWYFNSKWPAFTHSYTLTQNSLAQMQAKASAQQEQCPSVEKRSGGDGIRGWVRSPRLSLCGSETSAGGSSWTQRTEGDLENELRTECPDYWCSHSYEYCAWCRLNHSVRSSYSDEYSALFPFGSGMRILLAHLSNRKPLFLT